MNVLKDHILELVKLNTDPTRPFSVPVDKEIQSAEAACAQVFANYRARKHVLNVLEELRKER